MRDSVQVLAGQTAADGLPFCAQVAGCVVVGVVLPKMLEGKANGGRRCCW